MADRFIDVEFAACVDRDDWDAAIRGMGGTVFHSSAWADYSVAICPGATPLYMIFRAADGSPVARALGFVQRSQRSVLRSLTASMWLDAHPVLGDNASVDVESVLRALAVSAREHVQAVELRINSFACPGNGASLARSGFSLSKRLEFCLDLRRTEEELWKGLISKRRTDIRKAEKRAIECVTLTEASGVESFRRLQGESSARIMQRGGPDIRFNATGKVDPVTTLLASGAGTLVGARYDQEIVSAVLLTVFNGISYLVLAGHARAGMEAQAPTYLLWRTLCDLRSKGVTQFNLGGCSSDAVNKESPEHGVYRYKRVFGGDMLECVSGHSVIRPTAKRGMDLLRGVVRRVQGA